MTADPNRAVEHSLDRTSLILTVGASMIALLFFGPRAALSVAVGGLLSYINFHWLKQAVDFVVLKGGSGRVGIKVALRYAGRYALIGLVLYATIRFSILDLVLVLAGLFVYVVAVLMECIFEVARFLVREYRNGRT